MITAEQKYAIGNFHTSIGAVTTAALIAFGFRGLVGALRRPLAALLVSFINLLLERRHAQVMPLASPSFYWRLEVAYALSALIILALAVRLGFWLNQKKAS
jgi:hypothetical protein